MTDEPEEEKERVPRMPDVPDDFDERLAALEAKGKAKRLERESAKAHEERRQSSEQKSARGLGIGMSIAYTVIGMPMFGYGIGWLIDRAKDTEVWKGYMMLLGSIGGIVMAVVILNRTNSNR